jgi:hypothetical protein
MSGLTVKIMELKPKITDKNGRDVNGRFNNGNQGKPKGATNKTTKDLKQFVTNFLNDKAFEIPLIWDSLDDKDKATLFLHLSRLVMPKPFERNEIDYKNAKFEFDEWTPPQIIVNVVPPNEEERE